MGVRCAILIILGSYSFHERCWCQAGDDTFWQKIPIANSARVKTVSMVLSSGLWYVVCKGVFSASWCVVLFRRKDVAGIDGN